MSEDDIAALAGQHADVTFDRKGRTSWDFDGHQLAAFARAVERAARAAAFDEAIALALQHAEAAKRTDDAASSLRLLVTKLRARAEGQSNG